MHGFSDILVPQGKACATGDVYRTGQAQKPYKTGLVTLCSFICPTYG